MAETDLADLRKQCIASLHHCADNISKYLDDDKEAEFAKLKSYVEEYCVMEAQQEVAMQALEKAKADTDISNIDTLQDRFTSNLETLAFKNLNTNNHPEMIKMKKRIETGMLMSRDALEQSELAMTESQQVPVDPITKRPIEDPVKNSVCGHVYERESIMKLIKMKQRTKCPVAGCGNRGPVVPDHLITDDEYSFHRGVNKHSTLLPETVDSD